MLSTLDRYILVRFARALLVVTAAVSILIIVINLVEELRDFVDHKTPLKEIFLYYVYFAGWTLRSFLPLFAFLGGLFAIGSLARTNEILALNASGVSTRRITLPLFIVAALLGGAHFYYNEYIYPPANARRLEIKEFFIENRPRESVINRYNIYRQISDSAYYVIDVYSAPDRRASGVKLFRRDRNRLGEFMGAREMVYINGVWHMIDGAHRVFREDGDVFTTFDTLAAPIIADKPADFETRLGKPEDMSYDDLKGYIGLMERTGGPYTAELVDLKFKLAFPFTSIIVMLLVAPLATRHSRGGFAGPLAISAAFILVYFVSFKVMRSLGANEIVSPNVAAWAVNGVFLAIGAALNFSRR